MQYRSHRYRTEYPVDLKTSAGPQRGKVLDVNNHGARMDAVRGLHRGDPIQFDLLGHQINAVVQWSFGARIGITFRPMITDDQVDTLRYRRDARKVGRHSTVGFAFQEMR